MHLICIIKYIILNIIILNISIVFYFNKCFNYKCDNSLYIVKQGNNFNVLFYLKKEVM